MIVAPEEVPNVVSREFAENYIHFMAFQKDERFSVYWEKCMEAVRDTEFLKNIIFCNDALKIPPVKVFWTVHEEFFLKETNFPLLKKKEDRKEYDFVKRGLGAFWGAVFKFTLGYKYNKSVAAWMLKFGIKTASIFEREKANGD